MSKEKYSFVDLDAEINQLSILASEMSCLMVDQQEQLFEIDDDPKNACEILYALKRASVRHMICIRLVHQLEDSAERLYTILESLWKQEPNDNEDENVGKMLMSLSEEKKQQFMAFLYALKSMPTDQGGDGHVPAA